MKKGSFVIIICSLLAFTSCKSKKPGNLLHLNLDFTLSKDYCGGAMPEPEILKEITAPTVYENGKVVFVLRNDEGIVQKELEFTTGKNGKLEVDLEAGNYDVYNHTQSEFKKMMKDMDENTRICSEAHFLQPLIKLNVFEEAKQKINLHVICNPCLPPAP